MVNYLGWKELVQVEGDEQRTIAREIEAGIRSLAQQNRISKSMAISQFLNSQGEES